jgi:hypothetical protein
MCANCKTHGCCTCTGGATLAVCACQSGDPCLVCGHDANAHVTAESNLRPEADRLDVLAATDPDV